MKLVEVAIGMQVLYVVQEFAVLLVQVYLASLQRQDLKELVLLKWNPAALEQEEHLGVAEQALK